MTRTSELPHAANSYVQFLFNMMIYLVNPVVLALCCVLLDEEFITSPIRVRMRRTIHLTRDIREYCNIDVPRTRVKPNLKQGGFSHVFCHLESKKDVGGCDSRPRW